MCDSSTSPAVLCQVSYELPRRKAFGDSSLFFSKAGLFGCDEVAGGGCPCVLLLKSVQRCFYDSA